MKQTESYDTFESKLRYWSQEGESLALGLYRYLKELSTKIPDSSKTQPVELVFLDRRITANDWCILKISLVFLRYHPTFQEIRKKPLLFYTFKEFESAIHLIEKRMNRTKFCNFHFTLEEIGSRNLKYIPEKVMIHPREWIGNYQNRQGSLLRYYFKLRGPSKRRPKYQERVRGYRDHGGASSVSERARRSANTSTWNEFLQQVLEHIQETGCSIEVALRVFHMEQKE